MTKKSKPAAPTAESITKMLTDDLAPGLAAMVAQIQGAEAAYSTTPPIRAGFDDHEADDGIASLRHYLEHAAAQVRRILAARRCPRDRRRRPTGPPSRTAPRPAGQLAPRQPKMPPRSGISPRFTVDPPLLNGGGRGRPECPIRGPAGVACLSKCDIASRSG